MMKPTHSRFLAARHAAVVALCMLLVLPAVAQDDTVAGHWRGALEVSAVAPSQADIEFNKSSSAMFSARLGRLF